MTTSGCEGARGIFVAVIYGVHLGWPVMNSYAELHCHSAFSLLDGASTPEVLVERAAELGITALALTDHDDLGGAVRFSRAARAAGLEAILGVELTVDWSSDQSLNDEHRMTTDECRSEPEEFDIRRSTFDVRNSPCHITLLARTAEGYANISELITLARRVRGPTCGRGPSFGRGSTLGRGRPRVTWDDLAEHAGGLLALSGCPQGELARRVRAGDANGARMQLDFMREIYAGHVAVEVWDHALPEERVLADRLLELADERGLPAVATNDVHYATPSGRIVHDVLTCLRHEVTLDEAGTRLRPNGEWYLKPASVVWRRWRHRPDVVRNSLALAAECPFRLSEIAPPMPGFSPSQTGTPPAGVTLQEYLEALVWQGAMERYGGARGQLRNGDPIRVETPARDGAVQGDSRFTARGSRSRNVETSAWAAHELRSEPPALPLVRRTGDGDEPKLPAAPPASQNGGPGPGLTQCVRRQIRHELAVIERLQLAGYFLTVWDIVRFARRRGILLQGRGSAANSCVCYCLGITAVDPIKFDLLFERFLSEERGGAPDIDLDIEHDRREEVLQYVYRKYGRDHAAMVCETITYRGRSAVRDAARVLGFSTDVAGRLADEADRYEAADAADALENGGLAACGLQEGAPEDPTRSTARGAPSESMAPSRPARELRYAGPQALPQTAVDSRVRALVHVVRGLDQLPRHRSIHVGGFVLTDGPLARVVPIEPAAMPDRTVIQWDKDDLDFAGLIKIDLLGLGMLTCLAKAIRYIRETRNEVIDLAQLPADDEEVYRMIQAADTVGVFQIESRAQMNSLPRLKPENFYDLVVQVALIRPGPIQGDMVHPYVRRRRGEEPVTYLHPDLKPILHRTLGVSLFQEQGMKVAVALAGFTPGQADALRRAMGFKRSKEAMAVIEPNLRAGMTKRGISQDVQDQIVKQLTAFASYGFPESHAASFALLVYASAYLKRYYAPEFFCAILNAQPMGFYAPSTLVNDARRHGVEVRSVDLAYSNWDCTLEPVASGEGAAWGSAGVHLGSRSMSRGAATGRARREPLAPCRATGVGMVEGPPRSKCPLEAPTVPSLSRIKSPLEDPQHVQTSEAGEAPGTRGPPRSRASEGTPSSPPPALRIGLRYVRGLGSKAEVKLKAAWEAGGPFRSVEDVVRRSRLSLPALKTLAEAGAFDTLWGPGRRSALWEVLARLAARPLAPVESKSMDGSTDRSMEDPRLHPKLREMKPVELVAADYMTTGLCTHGHPMEHLRAALQANGVLSAEELKCARSGERVKVAGVVICRQRPGTAKGVCFITLEDETGFSNFVVYPDMFQRYHRTIVRSPVLLIEGIAQNEQDVINVQARRIEAMVPAAGADAIESHDFH